MFKTDIFTLQQAGCISRSGIATHRARHIGWTLRPKHKMCGHLCRRKRFQACQTSIEIAKGQSDGARQEYWSLTTLPKIGKESTGHSDDPLLRELVIQALHSILTVCNTCNLAGCKDSSARLQMYINEWQAVGSSCMLRYVNPPLCGTLAGAC